MSSAFDWNSSWFLWTVKWTWTRHSEVDIFLKLIPRCPMENCGLICFSLTDDWSKTEWCANNVKRRSVGELVAQPSNYVFLWTIINFFHRLNLNNFWHWVIFKLKYLGSQLSDKKVIICVGEVCSSSFRISLLFLFQQFLRELRPFENK